MLCLYGVSVSLILFINWFNLSRKSTFEIGDGVVSSVTYYLVSLKLGHVNINWYNSSRIVPKVLSILSVFVIG